MNIHKGKLVTAMVVVAIGCVFLLILGYNGKLDKTSPQNLIRDSVEYTTEKTMVKAEADSAEASAMVVVQIAGEVKNPDVYELEAGSRLNDLVDKAGGFTENAYTDNLNLAEKLEDGNKYIVYNASEDIDKIQALEDNIGETVSSEDSEGLININTADIQTLKRLDGIGDTLAERIIEYRNSYGDFSSTEEIREVEGIGDGIYNKIKDDITISSGN